jgi:protein-S-isoprenylcysteine O-methyltransferase Ste14
MDPINIIVAINLFVSMSANISGAKKGMKSILSNVVKKPKTYLQTVPPNVAALVFIATIAGIFNLGVFSNQVKDEHLELRIIGLLFFIIFSWVQVYSFKSLGEFYSQDILIFKKHELIQVGPYKILRHPQYVSQLLSDLGAGVALMGYLIIPLVLLIQIPLFVLRARAEDKLLAEYFKEKFDEYKNKSGFFIPFLG